MSKTMDCCICGIVYPRDELTRVTLVGTVCMTCYRTHPDCIEARREDREAARQDRRLDQERGK